MLVCIANVTLSDTSQRFLRIGAWICIEPTGKFSAKKQSAVCISIWYHGFYESAEGGKKKKGKTDLIQNIGLSFTLSFQRLKTFIEG